MRTAGAAESEGSQRVHARHPQPNRCVGVARARVTLPAETAVVVAIVGEREDRHVGLVDLGERDPAAVRRPPVSAPAPELLLRDELRDAVGNGVAGPGRKTPRRSRAHVEEPQVAVPHECDPRAVGGIARIELGGGGVGQPAGRPRRRVVLVEVARYGDEDPPAVGGPLVGGDAPGREAEALAQRLFGFAEGLALAAQQIFDSEQAPALARRRIGQPEGQHLVSGHRVARGRRQEGDRAPVRPPGHLAEQLAVRARRSEDPPHGEGFDRRLRSGARRRALVAIAGGSPERCGETERCEETPADHGGQR